MTPMRLDSPTATNAANQRDGSVNGPDPSAWKTSRPITEETANEAMLNASLTGGCRRLTARATAEPIAWAIDDLERSCQEEADHQWQLVEREGVSSRGGNGSG